MGNYCRGKDGGGMNRGPSNPLALGLVLIGALTMAIATFLPLDEPTGAFRMVQSNTLIQHGGWEIIGLAVGIAASGFWASQRDGKWALTVVLCLIAAAQIVYWFTDKDTRTLYPVSPDGTTDTSQPGTVVALGIALYVAGAGVALALIGTLMLRQAERAVEDPLVAAWREAKTTKKCPDCAETILADAKVCKHCGYRFTPTNASDAAPIPPMPPPYRPPTAPPKQPSGESTKIKCHHCEHVQAVPLSQQTFACEECGTKLRRATEVN
jgi:ribosomal protein S27E